MSDIVLVNIGATANDGTGDPLRDGMDIMNDNVTLLKNLQGPCVGTKYFDLRLAVKNFMVSKQFFVDKFYVSKIVCGASESGQYRYTVEVTRSKSYATNVQEAVVMKYTALVGSAKSGADDLYLAENSSSGYYGAMVVNWSLLTVGTTYTCSLPAEGFLYVQSRFDLYSSPPGGGGGIAIDAHTTDFVADGSKDLYQSTDDADLTLAPWDEMVGMVRFKNSHSGPVLVNTDSGTESIDGNTQLIIAAGTYIEIVPTSTTNEFVVLNGSYTLP